MKRLLSYFSWIRGAVKSVSSCTVQFSLKWQPQLNIWKTQLLCIYYPIGVWLWRTAQCALESHLTQINHRHTKKCFGTFSDIPSDRCPPSRLLWTTQLLWSAEGTPSKKRSSPWRGRRKRDAAVRRINAFGDSCYGCRVNWKHIHTGWGLE